MYPTYLYKYQKLTAHSLASILNDTAWFSNPSKFNDPFDCALTISSDAFEESMKYIINEIVAPNAKNTGLTIEQLNELAPTDRTSFDELRSSLAKIGESIGVLSLSAVANNILMWAHYADQHRGICVEYNFSDESKLRKMARKVKYRDEIPRLTITDIHGPNKNNFLDTALFTKAKHWEYEEEWRLISPEGNRLYAAPSVIKSIIFGARMSKEDKCMVFHALKSKTGISYKEAFMAEGRFSIEVKAYAPNKA